MVPSAWPEPGRVVAERGHRELGQRGSRGSLPPGSGRLGAQPGRVGEELADTHRADRTRSVRVQVLPDRVGQAQPAGVAQHEHGRCDKDLGDRSCPVLGVGIGSLAVHPTAATRPGDLAIAGKTGSDRREPLTCLITGKSDIEQALGPAFDHGAQGYSAPPQHPGSMIMRFVLKEEPNPHDHRRWLTVAGWWLAAAGWWLAMAGWWRVMAGG